MRNSNDVDMVKQFFIFSPGRSGSSLLSRMLNQHPNIAVPYESHLMNTFYPLIKYYGSLSEPSNLERLIEDILKTDVMNDWHPKLSKKDILNELKQYEFGSLFDAILSSWAKKTNKKIWGEKTPHHLYYWKELNDMFPKAKFIHLIRDGRDVASSFIKARFGPKTVFKAAHHWNNYINKFCELSSELNKDRILNIRYEDLLDNPEKTLSKLCDFLNQDYDNEMLNYHKNKTSYKTDVRNEINLKKGLMKENKEKWKNSFNDKELEIFESISGVNLKKFGYELATGNKEISSTEKIFQSYVIHPPKKIKAMLKNKKGHRDALIIQKIKLRLLIDYYFQRSNN